jgi:membrane AbrB-like protein
MWARLIASSLALSALMAALGLPAAWLLGPLLVGAGFGARGTTARVAKPVTTLAQATLGTFLSTNLTPAVLAEVVQRWPVVLSGALGVVLASAALGWGLAKWQVLPGSTAVWGTAPGAAPAMVVMAEAFGADARLVALMQYTRVALVVATAALVARLSGVAVPRPHFDVVDWLGVCAAALVVGAGALAGLKSRVPAGALLVPMVAGVLVVHLGFTVQVPMPVVAVAASVLGLGIGLSFTRQALVHAAQLLPRIVASIVALMLLCAVLALGLSRVLDVDFFTLWLATSPGGIDTVALIATATHADVSLVIALQATRFVLVMVLGPVLSRFVARRTAGYPRRG